MPAYDTTLVERSVIARETMLFRFARPAGFEFAAGQAVSVTLPEPPYRDAKGATRTFSVVSAPAENEIAIATRMRDSAYKRSLREMPLHTPVRLRGPLGRFTLERGDSRPAVLLAGGIGVTPFVSMLRHAAYEPHNAPIVLFHSNRTREDAAFLDELAELSRMNSAFRFVPTFTRANDLDSSPGERGPITAAMLRHYVPDMREAACYVAGPPGLVVAVRSLLSESGIPEARVRTDEFFGY